MPRRLADSVDHGTKVFVGAPDAGAAAEAFETQSLDADRCFLCGTTLSDTNRTEEHVVPRWLQRRYKLWNQSLTLLNGTSMPYKALTIPCCKRCNGGPLTRLERRIARASRLGYRAWREVDDEEIFLWLGKIFYGLLHREGFLLTDRSDPSAGPIVSAEDLEGFRMHHLFIQAISRPIVFRDFVPWSVFRIQLADDGGPHEFWMRDSVAALIMGIRCGDTAIIVSFQDQGVLAHYFGDLADQFASQPASQLELFELMAQLTYIRICMNRTPKYISFASEDPAGAAEISVMAMPLGGMSGLPLFDEGDLDEYAALLASFLGADPTEIRKPEGVWSVLGKRTPPVYPLALIMDPRSRAYRRRQVSAATSDRHASGL